MAQLADTHNNNLQLNFTLKENDRDHYDQEEQGVSPEVAIPSLWGIPLKYISLVTLAVQNSLLTIIMHYSRVSTPPSRAYSAATAVLLNELLKGSISLFFAFIRIETPHGHDVPISGAMAGSLWNPRTIIYRLKKLGKEIFSNDCWKLSIPAILYVIQNNLQYVAASNLEAATFQVSYQMKILTTAAFSVLLLRKKLTPSQWFALFCLAVGVGIVQIQTASPHKPSVDTNSLQPVKGFLAVVAACFTSGLAGVYFEMVLKGSQADLWVRNVQLSVFSLLPALVPIFFTQASSSPSGSAWITELFHNFGAWAWATVFVQVLGGLVTAMVIKYSDNILKGFATSLSIVISFLASVALFDFQMTFTFILGSVIVLIATWLYNQPPKHGSVSGSPRESKGWSIALNEKSRSPRGSLSPPRSNPNLHEFSISLSSRNPSSSSLSNPIAPVEREQCLALGLPSDLDLDGLKKPWLASSGGLRSVSS